MQKRVLGIFLSSVLMAPMCAMAGGSSAPGSYVGGVYSEAAIDSNDFSDEAEIGVLSLRGGYQANQNVAIEARFALATDADHVDGWKIDVEDMYGLYLKAGLPTQIGLYPYALIGMTHAKVEASWHGFHRSESGSDISFGLGADYWFNSQVSAGLEWAKLYDKDGADIDSISLGLNFKF